MPRRLFPSRRLAHGLLACALALAFAGPVSAATKKKATQKEKAAEKPAKPRDNRVWSSGRDGDAFILQFGAPGAAAPLLAATCRPGAGIFQVVAEVSPAKARVGDAVKLVLGNGKVKVEFAASVFPSVTEGRSAVDAQVTIEPKLVELFKQADTLHIVVPGTTESVPLLGAQARVPDFEKACLRATILPASTGTPAKPDGRPPLRD